MKKRVLTFLTVYSLVVFHTISCNNENSTKENEINNPNTASEAQHSIEIDTIELDYEFLPPSPVQIASILKKADMHYEEGLTNPASNMNHYSTPFKQSLNFGVYTADLSYCITNDKYSEASDYLKTIKKLGSKIGLDAIFQSNNLVERFEKNMGNQDSIIELLFNIQIATDDYIHDNELRDLSVIYFAGAWIELMNIGTHTIIGNNDKKISTLLSEQMTIANSIVKGLNAVKNKNEDLILLTEHLEEVTNEYNNLWSVKKEGDNIEYLDIELQHDEVMKISDKILELRDEITM